MTYIEKPMFNTMALEEFNATYGLTVTADMDLDTLSTYLEEHEIRLFYASYAAEDVAEAVLEESYIAEALGLSYIVLNGVYMAIY